jgi:hypothetical protein
MIRTVGVAVGLGVISGLGDSDGDPAAIAGALAGALPPSGGMPRKAVARIPRATITRPTPMMVRRGMPPESSPLADG